MLRLDRYRLTRSPAFTLSGNEEARQDLTLDRAVRPRLGVIFGFLYPHRARARAVVKVLTAGGDPVAHTRPNRRTGLYLLEVGSGCYRLAAASPGFETFLSRPLRVRPGGAVRRDVFLPCADSAPRAAVEGRVFVHPERPLAGAGVALAGTHAPSAGSWATRTNPDGEYVLPGLAPGEYLLVAWGPGRIPMQQRLVLPPDRRVHRDIVLNPGN